MTRDALIKKISASDADGLVKAQAIALVRDNWEETRMIPMEELFEMCCRCTEITIESGRSKNRRRENVRARQLFVHYGKKWFSLTAMAKYLNHRDHSSLVHNKDVAIKLLEAKDDVFLFDLANLERVIAGEEPVLLSSSRMPQKMITMVHDARKNVYYSSVKHLSLTLFGCDSKMGLFHINKRFGKRYFKTDVPVRDLGNLQLAPPV